MGLCWARSWGFWGCEQRPSLSSQDENPTAHGMRAGLAHSKPWNKTGANASASGSGQAPSLTHLQQDLNQACYEGGQEILQKNA